MTVPSITAITCWLDVVASDTPNRLSIGLNRAVTTPLTGAKSSMALRRFFRAASGSYRLYGLPGVSICALSSESSAMAATVAPFFAESESAACMSLRVTGLRPAMISAIFSLYTCMLRSSCSSESRRMMFSTSIVRDFLPG